MKRNLKNKIVWITGAGSGIGQNSAITLSKLGMKVILSGRNLETLQETALKCDNEVSIKVLDVSYKESVKDTVKEIEREYKNIDILINAAGINIENRDWDNINENDWDKVFQTNINGLFYCCKSVIPLMKVKQDGLIINVSSWSGNHISLLSGVSYTSSKHAVNAMTETINMKYCNIGIRACAICPGEVSTPLLDQRPIKLSQKEKDQMLQTDDISETVCFVAQMPKHVCVNQMTISPTWNRLYTSILGIEKI